MKRVIIGLVVLFFIGFGYLYYISKLEHSEIIFSMNTVISVKLYGISENKAMEAFDKIKNLYDFYDGICDRYNEESELYKLNSGEIFEVSDELFELIDYGISMYNISDGLLNINSGELTSLWNYFRNGLIDLPSDSELSDIIISGIELDGTKFISDVNIDLGSIAKGYVTAMVSDILSDMGIKYYIVNAGGNVLLGESMKGTYSIGLKSPIESGNFMIINDSNVSVVTSGSYERFYEYEGQLYHHLIDPNTKMPANYMKSVTVVGSDSALCDALSTILFLMPISQGLDFIKNYDVSVVYFTIEDEVIKSENFIYE